MRAKRRSPHGERRKTPFNTLLARNKLQRIALPDAGRRGRASREFQDRSGAAGSESDAAGTDIVHHGQHPVLPVQE